MLLGASFLVVTGLRHRAAAPANVPSGAREASPSSADPDELVTEGELLLDRRTPESMRRAVEVLTRRTQQPPAHAPAYAALAKALCLVREYSTIPSARAFPLAEEAANQALRLDPENADAHAALGFVSFFWKWDVPAAERHFGQALTLAPASATAHQWYGSMLLHQGKVQEALKQLNQAQHLAPASTAIISTRAMALSLSGQRDAANNILKKLELDAPEALPPHRTAAYLSLQETLDIPTFLNETEKFSQLRRDRETVAEISQARKIFQAKGKVPMLQFLLSEEKKRTKDRQSSFRKAEIEALLGQDKAAVSHAALAVQNREDGALGLAIDPPFERLRSQGKLDETLKTLQNLSSDPKWKN